MSKSTERFWERVDWLKEHRPDMFYVHIARFCDESSKGG